MDFFIGMGFVGIIIGVVTLVIYFWSIVWTYRDAERRGRPGWLVALLVAIISWPLSLFVWLLIRPRINPDLYNER